MAKKPASGEPTLPTLGSTPAGTAAGAAPRFEYEILRALADDADLLSILNEHGTAGWQAFAVTVTGDHRGAAQLAIFLRRELRS